jgi:Zn-dependent peptidase ImmA (M78 family)
MVTTLLTNERPTDHLGVTVREAEAEAALLLEQAWWPRELPVDPFHLARVLGIAVRVLPLPADESGNITITPDETPMMTLNRFDSESRRRFTCAHEIGHYLRRSAAPRREYVDYRDTLAGLGTDREEIFANQFAAALLMPADHVARFHRQGLAPEVMARKFGTSAQAMEIRLRNLGLVTT